MKRTYLFVILIVIVGWMLMIFLFSSQTSVASNKNSRAIVGILLKISGQEAADNNYKELEKFNLMFRKCSHFGAYLILAILILFMINKLHTNGYLPIFISFAICAVFAVSDEIHQRFVPGRTSAIADVLIDCTGAILGIALYTVVRILKGKKQRN